MFVVALFNHFDNVIEQSKKDYPSLVEAYLAEYRNFELDISMLDEELREDDLIEQIKEEFFNCDSAISIIEV